MRSVAGQGCKKALQDLIESILFDRIVKRLRKEGRFSGFKSIKVEKVEVGSLEASTNEAEITGKLTCIGRVSRFGNLAPFLAG